MTSASVFQSFVFSSFAEILINRSWTCAVKEHEDFEFLFHDFVVLSFRACVAHAGRVRYANPL